MVYIRLQFEDGNFDYVSNSQLKKLFESKKVKMFYRPSEKQWIVSSEDPRKKSIPFAGPDRRKRRTGDPPPLDQISNN